MFTNVIYLARYLVVSIFFWSPKGFLYANEAITSQVEQSFLIPQIIESVSENNSLAMHNGNALSLASIQATKSYEKGNISEIIFSGFKSLKEFVDTLATDENYAFFLMRMVAKEISASSFKHFRISFVLSNTDIKLIFSNTSSADGSNIYAAYDQSAAQDFSEYLKENNAAAIFRTSVHTVSFPSKSGNILVIPKGTYVNFYDFALNANSEEIVDFWQHVSSLMNEFKTDQFDLASHAGSQAGQTVFHFHLRFEFHDKSTKERIKRIMQIKQNKRD